MKNICCNYFAQLCKLQQFSINNITAYNWTLWASQNPFGIVTPFQRFLIVCPTHSTLQALADFSAGATSILTATAVLARGLDIPDVQVRLN